MPHGCKHWLIALYLAAMLASGWSVPASAEGTLIWLLRDLPPLTIFEGPGKGQGALDQLLPILIGHLPEYRHQVMHVNHLRSILAVDGRAGQVHRIFQAGVCGRQ